MDLIHRQFMVRRLAAVKQKKCYIQIFKLIVEHDVPYTVKKTASSSICRICPTTWCGRSTRSSRGARNGSNNSS